VPRTGPRRRTVALKSSEAGIDWITQRALSEGLVKNDGTANISAFLRLVVAFAQREMPAGWRP